MTKREITELELAKIEAEMHMEAAERNGFTGCILCGAGSNYHDDGEVLYRADDGNTYCASCYEDLGEQKGTNY